MNTHDINLPDLPPCFEVLTDRLQTEIRAYARAAIEADRKRRGEPVGYIMPTSIKQLKAGGNAIVGGVSQGCDVPIYTAPQPAETVKMPSDDDIRRVARDMYLAGDLVWLGFDKDENGEYTQPKISSANITLIRALLARYGGDRNEVPEVPKEIPSSGNQEH